MRTTLPVLLTFALGTLMVLEFFVPDAGMHHVVDLLREWGAVLAAAAFLLGAINVVQVNLPKIRRRESDWGYKVALIGSALATLVAGFWGGKEGRVFLYFYEFVFAPANATMFALLAFFIASAAFRAFRARNLDATLMLGAAIVVMVGVIPVGEWVSGSLPLIKDWILNYANNAGRRAILVGAALGAIATGLRVILGIERSHLGND